MAEPRAGAPVALTGGTGFVGRRIQRALIARGQRPRLLLRPGSRNADHVAPEAEAVTTPLHHGERLAEALRDVRALVYCAGSVRGRRLEDFLEANVTGVARVVETLSRHREPPPLLLISSLAATRPELSDYARSKHLGEEALAVYPGPWAVLRPPAVYGPGDRELTPLFAWMRRGVVPATGPAGQRLSFLHVDDLARAVLAWLERWPECHGRRFSLDDGRPGGYGWDEIAQAVARRPVRPLPVPLPLLRMAAAGNRLLSSLLGYAPMLTPGKLNELRQPEWLADSREFSAATGWSPAIDLASGVAQLFSDPETAPSP